MPVKADAVKNDRSVYEEYERNHIRCIHAEYCILFHIFAKSYYKQLSVLFGLVVGYILATLPDAVLGCCTIMMFGTIVVSGLQMIQNVFGQNCVAVVFLVAIILNLVLPENMEAHTAE